MIGGGELSADHAWRARRRYGGWRLLRDAFVRFRYGDGFSHARALWLQLLSVGLLTAVVALTLAVGQVERGANRIYGVERDRPSLHKYLRALLLTVVTVSVLFRYAPRRHQPSLSWLMVGAGLATALWWLVSLLLAAYVTQSHDFGATYGPLTGVMALLLWANFTGIALFLGVAFAAQLEARRVGASEPAAPDQWEPLEERTGTRDTSRT